MKDKKKDESEVGGETLEQLSRRLSREASADSPPSWQPSWHGQVKMRTDLSGDPTDANSASNGKQQSYRPPKAA